MSNAVPCSSTHVPSNPNTLARVPARATVISCRPLPHLKSIADARRKPSGQLSCVGVPSTAAIFTSSSASLLPAQHNNNTQAHRTLPDKRQASADDAQTTECMQHARRCPLPSVQAPIMQTNPAAGVYVSAAHSNRPPTWEERAQVVQLPHDCAQSKQVNGRRVV